MTDHEEPLMLQTVFTAEAAAVESFKLYVLGGVLGWWKIDVPPATISVATVAIFDARGLTPGEPTPIKVRVVGPDGRQCNMRPADGELNIVEDRIPEQAFVVIPTVFEVTAFGDHRIIVELGTSGRDLGGSTLEVRPSR